MSPSGSASDIEEWFRDLLVEPPSLESTCVSGNNLRTREARAKRTRSQNWSKEEKQAYMQLKAEAPLAVKGKPWDFISRGLWDRHRFERDPKCCEDLWGTFLKAHRAIQRHEAASQSDPQWVGYWDMDEPARSHHKLPRLFLLEWWTMIDGIVAAPARRPRITNPGKHSAGKGAIIEEEAEFDVAAVASLFKRDIHFAVRSALQSLPCRETPGATLQDTLLRSIAPLIKQQVEAAVAIDLEVLALKGFVFDEDDPGTQVGPFVRNCINAALGSTLQRLSAPLQDLAQQEQEYEERLRAIDEQRRALDLEQMQIQTWKRQRVNPPQRTRRTRNKRQGRRGRNSSAGGGHPSIQRLEPCEGRGRGYLLKPAGYFADVV